MFKPIKRINFYVFRIKKTFTSCQISHKKLSSTFFFIHTIKTYEEYSIIFFNYYNLKLKIIINIFVFLIII